MRIVLGGVAMPTVDGTSVHYKNTTSDPVPVANVTIVDQNSSIFVAPLAELLIIDEKVIANPTQNFLLGPALLSGDTSQWFSTSSAGFGGTVDFTGAPPVTAHVLNDNHIGFALRAQNIQFGLIVPGQQYMLSGYIQIATPMNNAQSILKFGFLDVNSNYLGDAAADYRSTTAAGGRVRVSVSATAPANAASIQVAFGIQTTAQPTNSGTALFDTIQLEPMWFPTIINYPSPDCLPTSANCRVLPNETTIRQYRKFGGFALGARYGNYLGNKRDIDITAYGYAWLFSGVFTISQQTSQTDNVFITRYLDTYFPPRADGTRLFNVSNIVQGAFINNVQPNWDDLRSLFNSFAAQAGFFWTVDPYWSFVYQPPGYNQMPIALIADNSGTPDNVTTFPIYQFQAEMDATQLGASCLVLGGSVSTNLLTGLTAGTPVTTLDVAPLPAKILNGTIMGISGNQGITLSADAAAGATSLSIFSFNPSKNYGVGSAITTQPYVASVLDPASWNTYNQAIYGYGANNAVFLRKVNDGALQTVADVTNRGIAELIQYRLPRYIYHGMTNVELLVGQGIQVTSNTDNLNAQTLLIQQVAVQWLGTNEFLQDEWEYQVDLGAVNRNATSIMSHIFRQTTKNASAPSVTNTALVAFEKFGFVDVPQSPYALAVLSDSPNGYYRLGESTSTIAYDSSGNGFNGTINASGVTLGVAGAITNDPNTAMTFDGVAGQIALPSGDSPTGWAALTLEYWLNLSTTSLSTQPAVIANDTTGTSNKGVVSYLGTTAQSLNFILGTGTAHTSLAANFQFSTGTWYHVACTWDGSTMRIYINGALKASTAFAGPIGASTNLLTIAHNPAGTDFFTGTLDEVAVYQAALSAARVLKHYNVGITGKA